MYVVYDELIKDINDTCPIKLAKNNLGIGMVNHKNPVSITQTEFNFIKDTIIKLNLKSGYELATAFGISALAAGMGFAQTGGKLLTVDAYIEEKYNDCDGYKNKSETYKDADGYKVVSHLIEKYNVPIDPRVGWSPNDIPSIIKDTLFDYVFIDALHYDNAVQADINAIKDNLADKYIIFLHDVHCFGQSTIDFLIKLFGKSWTLALDDDFFQTNYKLSYITNMDMK